MVRSTSKFMVPWKSRVMLSDVKHQENQFNCSLYLQGLLFRISERNFLMHFLLTIYIHVFVSFCAFPPTLLLWLAVLSFIHVHQTTMITIRRSPIHRLRGRGRVHRCAQERVLSPQYPGRVARRFPPKLALYQQNSVKHTHATYRLLKKVLSPEWERGERRRGLSVYTCRVSRWGERKRDLTDFAKQLDFWIISLEYEIKHGLKGSRRNIFPGIEPRSFSLPFPVPIFARNLEF